jgi:opacity protein-like surface antigen
MKAIVTAGLFTALCLVSRAGVDIYTLGSAETVKVGAFAAFSSGGDLEEDNFTGGANFGYMVTKYLALELTAFEISDELDLSTSVPGLTVDGGVDQEAVVIGLNVLLERPLLPRFGIYGGGGIGYYLFDPDKDLTLSDAPPFDGQGAATDFDIESDNEFGYHLLFGARLVVTYNVELFVDYWLAFVDADFDFDATLTSAQGQELTRVENSFSGFDYDLLRIGFNCYF